MIVKKTVLLDALKKVMPGVDKGTGLIEGADTFVFLSGAVHTYNDAISVSVPLPGAEDLKGSVKAKEFFALVNKLASEDIEIDVQEGKWSLKAGRTRGTITLYQAGVVEFLQALKLGELAWKPLPVDFSSALRLCKMACNATPMRGIFVGDYLMISTDTTRINRYSFLELDDGGPVADKIPTDWQSLDPFWIDDPAAGELIKLGSLSQYSVSPGWVHFLSDDGAVFSCKKKDVTLFPAKQVSMTLTQVKKLQDLVSGPLPREIGEAVDRVSVFGNEQASGGNTITLHIHQLWITIESSRTTGSVSEDLPWEAPLETDPDLEVTVDHSFLVEAGRKVSSLRIKKMGDKQCLIFEADHYLQLAGTVKKASVVAAA